MKPTAYIETTIIGYLTTRFSAELITAGNQRLTRDWWEHRRQSFEMFTSEAVVQECMAGDPSAATERLDILKDIPLPENTAEVERLARELVSALQLPEKAEMDAMHIATAAAHGMAYLLTWNCTHIANASLSPQITAACRAAGFEPPIICTPQQLMKG